ncbi:type III pantothenate kinase [Gracilimonas tropica]|uniref:type III pantothenate kinase n=1 Tax=Gracilimonas tropica TaxID=454600 RepID=UPI000363F627|nr:type III pantothenate kinase [Gracilimonas tropica]
MSKFDSDSLKKILYLDVGNSSIKGAFRQGFDWETIHPKGSFSASDLIKWIGDHPQKFELIVLSGVRKDVLEAVRMNLENVSLKEITIQDVPRDLLDYETVDTLGIDRFLACYGATGQTSSSVVVIDAGTAITVDFMDQDDVFRGGVIAPGLPYFMEILPKKAPALPNVDIALPKNWPGKSTKESLQWGQAGFYKMALEKMMEMYEMKFGPFDLFITGGNGSLIDTIVEKESRLRPYLVFEGMERLVNRKN